MADMIMLGRKARDEVTGFEGIITARIEYLFGCKQVQLMPRVGKGYVKDDDGHWFDVGRIRITGRGIARKSVQAEKPGGPAITGPKFPKPGHNPKQ